MDLAYETSCDCFFLLIYEKKVSCLRHIGQIIVGSIDGKIWNI